MDNVWQIWCPRVFFVLCALVCVSHWTKWFSIAITEVSMTFGFNWIKKLKLSFAGASPCCQQVIESLDDAPTIPTMVSRHCFKQRVACMSAGFTVSPLFWTGGRETNKKHKTLCRDYFRKVELAIFRRIPWEKACSKNDSTVCRVLDLHVVIWVWYLILHMVFQSPPRVISEQS